MLFDIEKYNSLQEENPRKATAYLYSCFETALIESRFNEVNHALVTLDLDKCSVRCLVSLISIARRWKKYLPDIDRFIDWAINKIKVLEIDADAILEGFQN